MTLLFIRYIMTQADIIHSVTFFRIRTLGSAALNMCFIAAGRADAYYEFGIHCWDIAAGIVILKEAGGTSLGASGWVLTGNPCFGQQNY